MYTAAQPQQLYPIQQQQQPVIATQPLYTPFAMHGGYFHPGQQYSPPVPGGHGYGLHNGAPSYDAYNDELEAAYRRKDRHEYRRLPEGSLYSDGYDGYGDPGRTWDRDWDPSMVRDRRPLAPVSDVDGPKKMRSIE